MAPPCFNYMQYPWEYAVTVRICITCASYHQYPWVMSSVPVKLCSTRESYPQYPWVISSVPVRACSTLESYPQYPWVISSVPVSHILSPGRICCTRESYPQYTWGYAEPVREISFILHSYKFSHGYWGYDSSVFYMSNGLVWRWQKSDPKCKL